MKAASAAGALIAIVLVLAWRAADLPAAEPAVQVWSVQQGGVAHALLALDKPLATSDGLAASDATVRLHALGRDWPVHRAGTRRWEGWIGVDLATKPGDHPVRWIVGRRRRTQILRVTAGHFRISRITVPRAMAVFDARALARIRADHAALHRAEQRPVSARPAFRFRLLPVHGVVSTPFGARRFVNGEPRAPHSGLDIAAAEGTPVLAPMAGRVLMARRMFLSGNTVLVGHGEGLVSIYAHLRALEVHEGQWLNTGEKIGEVGATGRATGPHLHWGVRFRGARINPAALLPPAPLAAIGLSND